MKRAAALVALLFIIPISAAAQTEAPGFRADAIASLKATAIDPTTWAPAGAWYAATRLDWNSSQVFFRNGFVEGNRFYTVSGLPNSTPISYEQGNRQILMTTLAVAADSAVNNWTCQMIERAAARRFPTHRKLVKALGFTERIAFATLETIAIGTAAHYNQWQLNTSRAPQLAVR